MLYVLSLSPPEVAVKYFTSVHEFRLMTPGLSMAIVDARRRRIKPFENVDQLGKCPPAAGGAPTGRDSCTDGARKLISDQVQVHVRIPRMIFLRNSRDTNTE